MENFDIVKSQIYLDNNNENCCHLRNKNTKSPQYLDDYCLSPKGTCTDDIEYTKQTEKVQYPTRSYEKLRQLLSFEDAPEYNKHNPYILGGYRSMLPTKLCFESIFWWTNETINIWSHLFGWFLFIALTINDIAFLKMHASLVDKVIVGILLVCFQLCMILSTVYHTFNCRSEKAYDCFLTYDLFGIALSLLAIYVSGIYYAFWCHNTLRNFYTITVGFIFVAAMIIQIPQFKIHSNVKICMFVGWAAYGIVPTLHWVMEMGGFDNSIVRLLLPRVLCMYLIVGIAFLIYITKVPERWYAGKFDFLGHSHNWWHFFVLVALYYWHNTGMIYVEFRMTHGCATHLTVI